MIKALRILGLRETITTELFFWRRKADQAGGFWQLLNSCAHCVLEHRGRFWSEIRLEASK